MKEILIDMEKCMGCKSCEIACRIAHSETKSIYTAIFERKLPQKRVYVESIDGFPVPIQCRHCEEAPCTISCMTGALYKDENGFTCYNESICVGCFMCVMVCPFGIINRNRYEKKIVKCDRCPDREIPACVEACLTKALTFKEVEEFSIDKRKRYLTEFINFDNSN